jgi:phage I-like protein
VFAAAFKDGKVLQPQKDYWQKICATANSAEPLVEYLKTAIPYVKTGETHASKQPAGHHQEGTVITAAELTAAEKQHCKVNGLSEAGYAKSISELGYRPLAA